MLAHAPHVAYTTFLVIFGCLGFLPVAALRAQLGPPALGVNLGYAITSEGARVGIETRRQRCCYHHGKPCTGDAYCLKAQLESNRLSCACSPQRPIRLGRWLPVVGGAPQMCFCGKHVSVTRPSL